MDDNENIWNIDEDSVYYEVLEALENEDGSLDWVVYEEGIVSLNEVRDLYKEFKEEDGFQINLRAI